MNETLEQFREFNAEVADYKIAALLTLAEVIRTKEIVISKTSIKDFLEEVKKLQDN